MDKNKNGNQGLEMLNYNQLKKSRYKGVSETATLPQIRFFHGKFLRISFETKFLRKDAQLAEKKVA